MGGSRDPMINAPSNLITLCGSGTTGCHGWVEDHPREAKAMGWSVSRYANPAITPVSSWAHGWVLLLTSGDIEHLHDYTPMETT
jgi:hypothetical protein